MPTSLDKRNDATMYCGSLRRFLRKIASTFAADAAGTVIKQQLLSGKLRTKSNEPSNDQLYPNLLYGLKVYFCLWSHDVVVRQTLSDHVNHADAHVWLRRIVASTKSDSGSRDMIDIYIYIDMIYFIWYTTFDFLDPILVFAKLQRWILPPELYKPTMRKRRRWTFKVRPLLPTLKSVSRASERLL